MLKPPRVGATFGSPNVVQSSKILEKSVEMNIIHHGVVINYGYSLCKLVIKHNIYVTTFKEIAYGEMAELDRF